MRELKDYFCDYKQTQELIQLGLKNYKSLMVWNKENGVLKLGNSGVFTIARAPLRSQALDYFRELGYILEQRKTIDLKYYYYIFNQEKEIAVSTDMILDWVIAESALIDKLIELEKEARNGN